jgi:hypothetical protein
MEWTEIVKLTILVVITYPTIRYATKIVEKRNARYTFKQYQKEKADHYIKDIL